MMMGTGNLTELTEADSGGITALLMGICSELDIRNVLTVQVSPHTRRTIEEHDAARRLMFAASTEAPCQKVLTPGLSLSTICHPIRCRAKKSPDRGGGAGYKFSDHDG